MKPFKEICRFSHMWFQQDGARCHTTNAIIALLLEKFLVIEIVRFDIIGYSKDRVYMDETLFPEHMKTRLYQKVIENTSK